MVSSSDILQGKILIVDDQETNILLLERALRAAGYVSITSTRDPNEVCELHRKHCHDLILLDLEMPNMGFSGFQVMEQLKEVEQGDYLPVIVITAHPDHKLHALQIGARDFISKPFELTEMLARVHNMLELRLLHKECNKHIKTLEQKILELEQNVMQFEVGNDLARRSGEEVKQPYDKTVLMKPDELAAPAQAHESRGAKSHTVLYVEDNPANMKLVEQIIARHPDILLLTAVSGIQGVEIARASKPDVILMDINLPGINGIDALKILSKDPETANIPVIAVSANAMALDIEKDMKTGFFSYITKPIKVNELMEALYVALEFAEKNSAHKK